MWFNIINEKFFFAFITSSPIQLDHSKSGLDDVKDDGGLTIGVIKEKDYPKIAEMRRRDKTISRYIPFNEINDMDVNFEGGEKEIIKHLKLYSIHFLCEFFILLFDY